MNIVWQLYQKSHCSGTILEISASLFCYIVRSLDGLSKTFPIFLFLVFINSFSFIFKLKFCNFWSIILSFCYKKSQNIFHFYFLLIVHFLIETLVFGGSVFGVSRFLAILFSFFKLPEIKVKKIQGIPTASNTYNISRLDLTKAIIKFKAFNQYIFQ